MNIGIIIIKVIDDIDVIGSKTIKCNITWTIWVLGVTNTRTKIHIWVNYDRTQISYLHGDHMGY